MVWRCPPSTDRIQPSMPPRCQGPGLRGRVGTREVKEGAATALGAAQGVRVRAQPTPGPDPPHPISETGFDGCEARGGINYTMQKLNNRGERGESKGRRALRGPDPAVTSHVPFGITQNT